MADQQVLFSDEPLVISLFDVFILGVDYGQLIMEQERDNEDLYDAFQGMIVSQKFCGPSYPAQRRQPHDERWRNAKRKAYRDFMDLVARVAGGEKFEIKPF